MASFYRLTLNLAETYMYYTTFGLLEKTDTAVQETQMKSS
jgi:hypothetical protein